MAFGDFYNDAELLCAAQYSFLMAKCRTGDGALRPLPCCLQQRLRRDPCHPPLCAGRKTAACAGKRVDRLKKAPGIVRFRAL